MIRKNWDALGGFDKADRSDAVNLLGLRSQLGSHHFVIRCWCVIHVCMLAPATSTCSTQEQAHNLGVAEFCEADDRLLGVGFVAALDDPQRAVWAAREALDNGCAAIEVP